MIGLQDRLIFFVCDTLMEWRRAVESQGSIFHTFEVRLRVPSIHLFHQVSLYRCARGLSR